MCWTEGVYVELRDTPEKKIKYRKSFKYELKTKIVPRKSDNLNSPNMHFPQKALPQMHTASGGNSPTPGIPK